MRTWLGNGSVRASVVRNPWRPLPKHAATTERSASTQPAEHSNRPAFKAAPRSCLLYANKDFKMHGPALTLAPRSLSSSGSARGRTAPEAPPPLSSLLVHLPPIRTNVQHARLSRINPCTRIPENCSGRKRFELTHTFGKLRPNRDPMDMIFHDDKRQDVNFSFALKKLPTVEDDFCEVGLAEHGEPCDNGVCHEIRVFVCAESVAGTWHGVGSGRGGR